MQHHHLIALLSASLAAPCALAKDEIDAYAGVGFPGVTVGLRMDLGTNIAARVEHLVGLRADRSGNSSGVNYDANVRIGRAALLGDWHAFGTGLRFTAGLTFNNTKGSFIARGGLQDINGKVVDVTGRDFRLSVSHPKVTPYLGIGWTSKPPGSPIGLSYHADVGLQFGKFKASVTQNLVGVGGITQADVDSEVRQFQDSLNKLSVVPNLSVGASYRF